MYTTLTNPFFNTENLWFTISKPYNCNNIASTFTYDGCPIYSW